MVECLECGKTDTALAEGMCIDCLKVKNPDLATLLLGIMRAEEQGVMLDLKLFKTVAKSFGWQETSPINPWEFLASEITWRDQQLAEQKRELAEWQRLCLDLYREHLGDRIEGDWEGLMKEARAKLEAAGVLKEEA